MIPPEIEPLLTPIGAVAGAVLLYYVIGSRWLGPDNDFWRPIRRTVLPQLDQLLANAFGGFAINRSTPDELAATVDLPTDDVERLLAEQGYDRNPWAGLKRAPDGRLEYSSWAHRRIGDPTVRAMLDAVETLPVAGDVIETLEAMLARRQLHATLYEAGDGDQTDVYVHEEANSVNPLVAQDHYRAESQHVEKGVRRFRDLLLETETPHRIEGGS